MNKQILYIYKSSLIKYDKIMIIKYIFVFYYIFYYNLFITSLEFSLIN